MVAAHDALPGRIGAMQISNRHFVLGAPLLPPYPPELATLTVAMGCFWGVEKLYWQTQGVYTTMVGYTAGFTPNPTYEEVCSGQTGHTEAVRVVFDPKQVTLEALLEAFWENHDPTQGMRQGNDIGTQYRSGLYFTDPDQAQIMEATRDHYQARLSEQGLGEISTEICAAGDFYYAEDYHQQYLAKNPDGYCGHGGTGVCYLSR
ncbi:Peptide methionine sulfoxide reductase [gamma proteobacterium HdN1]|nr:Peptide methionine sulfoxide reductase [gamma proteobacterium HdN1]